MHRQECGIQHYSISCDKAKSKRQNIGQYNGEAYRFTFLKICRTEEVHEQPDSWLVQR